MAFVQDDFINWGWARRRFIVVWNDEVVRRAESEEAGNAWASNIEKAARQAPMYAAVNGGAAAVAGAAIGTAAGVAILSAAKYLSESRKRAAREGLQILDITESQAAGLSFPHGHPRPKVVYVSDPEVAISYYPVASFHRSMFDSKVSEAINLLLSLGATEISLECTEGYERGGDFNFSTSLPDDAGAEIGGGVKRKNKVNLSTTITMQLKPTLRAELPEGLVWFKYEKQWQNIARARLERGLQTFSLDVRYTDDLGVNANLATKIKGVGFEFGGKFTDYKETVWKLSGTFAEQTEPGATTS